LPNSPYIDRRPILVAALLASLLLLALVEAADPEDEYTLFRDDFEDGDADDWEIEVPEGSEGGVSVVLEGGNNVLEIRDRAQAVAGSPGWTDYTLEVRVKLLSQTSSVVIVFRWGDGEPTRRYMVQYWAGYTNLKFSKQAGDEFTDIAFTEDQDFNPDIWRTIKITSKNDEFWAYVDGELQLHVTDDAFPSGRIGFDADPDSLIHIDDVKVTTGQGLYVADLLERAEEAINQARIRGADTSDAEDHLNKARAAQDRGDLDSAESNAEEAIHEAETATAREDGPSQPSNQGDRLTWSVELIAGVVTIGAAIVGAAGWYYRARSTRRRGTILYNKFLNSVDDVYSRFKLNSNRCEAELLKLKEEIFRDFKEGLIEGENFDTLDRMIERYLREIREELERDQGQGT